MMMWQAISRRSVFAGYTRTVRPMCRAIPPSHCNDGSRHRSVFASTRFPPAFRCISSFPEQRNSDKHPTIVVEKKSAIGGGLSNSKLYAYGQLARIDKPIGTWLLYLPCTWSIGMSAFHFGCPVSDTLYMLGLFGMGSFIMRGAGCTINDMWDSGFDRMVDRTKSRPLANGTLTHAEALRFLAVQLSAGLLILAQMDWSSVVLGAASLPLVAMYPLAKRYTRYPQFILGLTFNWGALLGWPALSSYCHCASDVSIAAETVLPLYVAGVAWTLVYDTIYAHQDKEDDVKIGVNSTALTFGERTKPILSLLTLAATAGWTISGIMNGHSIIFFTSSFMAGLDLWRIVQKTDLQSPKSCNMGFRASQRSGWLLASGIMLDLIFTHAQTI